MANIDYKDGTYSIAAHSTEAFTFWWGRNSKAPHEFFDVFISPDVTKANAAMQPLVEVQRAVALVVGSGPPSRIVLTLTLRNDNAFPVTFIANHVRIYN